MFSGFFSFIHSRKDDTNPAARRLRIDGAAVNRNAFADIQVHRSRELAVDTKQNNAVVAIVTGDKLAKGRACDAVYITEVASAYMAQKLAADAKHGDAPVLTVSDGDDGLVAVPAALVHEAETVW
jgi:hypothetical protein